MSPSRPGLSPDLLKEIAKANRKRLERWSDELDRTGRVVLRTSFLKTFGFAVFAWICVGALVTMFTVMPLSMWNPLSVDFAGWVQLVFGLLLFMGLILFGFGAVLWTFVYPMVRPRTIVSRWGVQAVVSKPGGPLTLFEAAWSDIVAVGGGIYSFTRWPFPPVLTVRISAQGKSVQRKVLIRPRRMPETVVANISGMLRGRPRDVLAFLVQVQTAVDEGRYVGSWRAGSGEWRQR